MFRYGNDHIKALGIIRTGIATDRPSCFIGDTDCDLTYDNVAIPEIHTHKVTESNDTASDAPDAHYDSVAIPEVHIKKK